MKRKIFVAVNLQNEQIQRYLTDKAYYYIQTFHKDQKRKYTGEPYISHCMRVAESLLEKYPDDFCLYLAGFLHDTLEDTDLTYGELVSEFGQDVADLVKEVTHNYPQGSNREERNKIECERLSKISQRGKRLKRADISDNLSDIALHNPNYATLYIQEKLDQLKAMGYHHDKKEREKFKEEENLA